MNLAVNALAHLLTDAVCAAVLFGRTGAGLTEFLLYNTLAFSTQCMLGPAVDRLRRHEALTAAAELLVVLGFILPLPLVCRVVVMGVGNSLFHLGGGTAVLRESGGRARKRGLFVAPGSVGLTLGTLYPGAGTVFAAALALCALALLIRRARPPGRESPPPPPEMGGTGPGALWTAIPLVLAVAIRALGGSAVSFPRNNVAQIVLSTYIFVFSGKAGGGFLCDRLGPGKTALLSLPAAAVCVAFFPGSMILSLLGQFLLNLTMPVTLYLLYRAMPDSPGFAFGLAASALWPGAIAGQLLILARPVLQLCILLCFAFALWAVLRASRRIHSRWKYEKSSVYPFVFSRSGCGADPARSGGYSRRNDDACSKQ